MNAGKRKLICALAEVAARERAIMLADGRGLKYVLNDLEQWEETEAYDGTPAHHANDDRRRPVFWTKRHCRIYDDPYGGSVGHTVVAYFQTLSIDKALQTLDLHNCQHYGTMPDAVLEKYHGHKQFPVASGSIGATADKALSPHAVPSAHPDSGVPAPFVSTEGSDHEYQSPTNSHPTPRDPPSSRTTRTEPSSIIHGIG